MLGGRSAFPHTPPDIVQNPTEGAYARSDLFERRRRLFSVAGGDAGAPVVMGQGDRGGQSSY